VVCPQPRRATAIGALTIGAGVNLSACFAEIPDLAAGGAGPAVSFCESRTPAPTFCADFDGVAAVGEGWDSTDDGIELAHVDLDSTLSVSGARSARTFLELEDAGSTCRYAQLHRSFLGRPAHFEVAVQLRPGPESDLAAVENFMNLYWTTTDFECVMVVGVTQQAVELRLQSFQGGASAGTDDVDFTLPGDVAMDWASLALSVSLLPPGGGPPVLGLAWKGDALGEQQLLTDSAWSPCFGAPADGSLDLNLGPHCTIGPQSFHFDDVVFDELPADGG
jgi:hypothetical protein